MHVGTSGRSYDHWNGVVYPPGTPPGDRLARYVRRFGTVELDASFYRRPRTATFASWRRRLPPGSSSRSRHRGLTHAERLYAPQTWVGRLTECWHDEVVYADLRWWADRIGEGAATSTRTSQRRARPPGAERGDPAGADRGLSRTLRPASRP